MLLGVEVEADLLLEEADDLLLPAAKFIRRGTRGAFDANAEGQRALVLARKRDEGLVTEHRTIVTLLYENALAG